VSAGGAMIDVLDGGQMTQARSWRAARKPGAAPSAGRVKIVSLDGVLGIARQMNEALLRSLVFLLRTI